MSDLPFYTDMARWWPLMSPVSEYGEEAPLYIELLRRHGPVRSVLELGSGGGSLGWWLRQHFDMTFVDLSPGMLAEGARINPGCPHHVGDMRTVRLGRTFDAVFVHDAICHMTSEHDLRAAMQTAWDHLDPGGVALFCPDDVREDFTPWTDCGGHDGEDGRALRFIEWSWDPDPGDDHCETVYSFVMRHPDGRIEAHTECHRYGIFSQDRWLDLMREVGFEAELHRVTDRDAAPGEGPGGLVRFLGRRPG